MELAERVAANAPLTNFAVLQALPMIAEANPQAGLLMESLMATVAQSDKEAKRRIRAFLDRKTAKVKPTDMSAKPNMSPRRRGASAHPLRAISFGNPAVNVERRDDGTIYLRPKIPLGDYPVRLTDRLHHWASAEPNRVFMAERDAGGGWRQITYAQLLEQTPAHRLGTAGARAFGRNGRSSSSRAIRSIMR